MVFNQFNILLIVRCTIILFATKKVKMLSKYDKPQIINHILIFGDIKNNLRIEEIIITIPIL